MRRTMMSAIIGCLVAFAIAQAQTPTPLIGESSPALPVSAVNRPLRIPPEANFGEVPSVALDARNHLYVFNRGSRPLMEFDADGRYVRELAQGLITRAHSVRVDSTGYIWLVDDTDHHVIRLDPSGRVVMVLGRRGRPGDTEELFNRPTDVAVNSRGEIFVADGYGNSRIVKFSSELGVLGSYGRANGQFIGLHGLAVGADGTLFTAELLNWRVQKFIPRRR